VATVSWVLVAMVPRDKGLPIVYIQVHPRDLMSVPVLKGYEIQIVDQRDTPLLSHLSPEDAAKLSAAFLGDRARRARATRAVEDYLVKATSKRRH